MTVGSWRSSSAQKLATTQSHLYPANSRITTIVTRHRNCPTSPSTLLSRPRQLWRPACVGLPIWIWRPRKIRTLAASAPAPHAKVMMEGKTNHVVSYCQNKRRSKNKYLHIFLSILKPIFVKELLWSISFNSDLKFLIFSGSSNSGSSSEDEETTKKDVIKGNNEVIKVEDGVAKPAAINPEESKPKRPISKYISGITVKCVL